MAGTWGRLDLTGRVALVTGGGSGMGESSAHLMAERGAQVLVVDRNEEGAHRVAAAIGGAAAAFVADVSDPDACVAMVEAAKKEFGHLNIAVHSAGVADAGGTLVGDTPVETWRRILSINLDGTFYCMRAEIPSLLEAGHGSIVNIGSIMSMAGLAHAGAYTASKHGVLGLTRAAALEYGNMDLRVNAIGPGNMDTPMTKRPFSVPEVLAEQLSLQAMTRLGEAWEVAEMVAFLASDAASFCTGAWMGVDGGYTAR
jgi:NAD(P)-dependent dehydrogenase (short-subunit alcohol dehydrogenase family)